MVLPISGTQDAAEAKRVFAGFEAAAKWHPAVTEFFLNDCGLQTMEDLLSPPRLPPSPAPSVAGFPAVNFGCLKSA